MNKQNIAYWKYKAEMAEEKFRRMLILNLQTNRSWQEICSRNTFKWALIAIFTYIIGLMSGALIR